MGRRWNIFAVTPSLLSPDKLFIVTWAFATIGAYLGPAERVYELHGVTTTFTSRGIIWLFLATLAFLFGVHKARRAQILLKLRYIGDRISYDQLTAEDSFRFQASTFSAYILTTCVFLLLIFWTALAVMKAGGFGAFVGLLVADWHEAFRLWTNQKPFVGARLLYTSLIASTLIAASGLGIIVRRIDDLPAENEHPFRWYLPYGLLFVLSSGPLILLPLLVSQRILLAMALFGGLITFIIASSRPLPLRYPILFVLLGFTVWTSQELLLIRLSAGGILGSVQHGISRALYYFTNDIGNMNRALLIDGHSYGYYSFNFVFRYLFIESRAEQVLLANIRSDILQYKAGGTWTALGAPYVDFGVAGLIIIFVWGYVSQLAYARADNNLFAAQVYGLLGAVILLSWHAPLWANPTFWLNVGLLFGMSCVLPAVVMSVRYVLTVSEVSTSETD